MTPPLLLTLLAHTTLHGSDSAVSSTVKNVVSRSRVHGERLLCETLHSRKIPGLPRKKKSLIWKIALKYTYFWDPGCEPEGGVWWPSPEKKNDFDAKLKTPPPPPRVVPCYRATVCAEVIWCYYTVPFPRLVQVLSRKVHEEFRLQHGSISDHNSMFDHASRSD